MRGVSNPCAVSSSLMRGVIIGHYGHYWCSWAIRSLNNWLRLRPNMGEIGYCSWTLYGPVNGAGSVIITISTALWHYAGSLRLAIMALWHYGIISLMALTLA